MITREHIIKEIKRTAEANGGVPLGKDRFFEKTGIRSLDWFGKYWAKWGDALIEAGYEPNKLQGAYEDDWVIEKLVLAIRDLGRFPSSGDIRLKSKQEKDFPSHTVFNRVGKKAELIRKTLEYCYNKGGFDDVIAICSVEPKPMRKESDSISLGSGKVGYVYLVRHGTRNEYKIGRTNNPIRREGELRLELPEKLLPIHYIETDDPAGIESYWHSRFTIKRKEGEWFSLTAEDVRAFKRWRRIY